LLDHADLIEATSPRIAVAPAASTTSLLPQALWASAAAVAVFLAVFASRTGPGVQRAATFVSSLHLGWQEPPHPAETPHARSDAEGAARHLAQTVQELMDDRDRTTARLTALEHRLDDMTGSTGRAEAAKAAAPEMLAPLPPPAPVVTFLPSDPWPDQPVPSDAATIIATIAPATDAATSWPPNVPAPIASLGDTESTSAARFR
jgi:hypothetical protein